VKPGYNNLKFKEGEELPEEVVRVNNNQVWAPKPLRKRICPACKSEEARIEPGIEKLHCIDCGYWEHDKSHPLNKPKEEEPKVEKPKEAKQ